MLINTRIVEQDNYIDLGLRKTIDVILWVRITHKVEINSLLLTNEIIQNPIRDEVIPRRMGLREILC